MKIIFIYGLDCNTLKAINLGKPEREEIERAEKITADILNKTEITTKQKENKWIDHCYELVKEINKDFNPIQSAKHIGNIYSGNEIGDIKILARDSQNYFYVELKMSESKAGKGTLANISQDALSKTHLFLLENILSWSEFRKRNRYSETILNELNKYKHYPSNLNTGSISKQIVAKGTYLRNKFQEVIPDAGENIANIICDYINDPKIKDIASIICEIIKIAKNDKINYLKYLSQLKQNPESIKKFVIAMLIGYHTGKRLNHILGIAYKEIFKILDRYSVYYTNEKSNKITVSKDKLGEEIKAIIESNIKIVFLEDQTNLLIESNDKKILRVVFHWKNVFQGIKTPCLNIFKEF